VKLDIKSAVQSAVLLRESFTDPMWQDVYNAVDASLGGFPGVAQAIGDAVILYEKAIPDSGESFDWTESLEKYATSIHEHVMEEGVWPDNMELIRMAKNSAEATQF